MTLARWVMVAVVCAATAPAAAFLPTSLNYSDPDLDHIFCPDNLSGQTWDHKAITREALRREVRWFFLESPPPGNQTLTIPEDASLSEIFRAYYGPTSSPTRFIKAVNSITWSNAMTEASGQQRFHAAYHMDGESILEGHELLQGRYQQLIATITVDKAYHFARELLGTSLNGIQDFYSQTTWVELGRDGVLEGLGLPGADIGRVAGPHDATCTNCDDTTGECRDNVIPDSLLTSGYYEYNAVGSDGFILYKPEGTGKCSHGGSLDTSVLVEATGGINKETSSPCFSPHHYLHQQAVDLATTASEVYLRRLRDTIGDENFRHLLDLYPGSALSIIIDTTGSMTYELAAVKEEARLIVEKTSPELYILVPYADPFYGPAIETTDPDVFLEELDKLEAYGGCCCLEEKFWHGLQLALIHTPDYSNIYCFTDAGANDAELMQGITALASSKHCMVSIIYSYNNGRGTEKQDSTTCPGYETSGVPELKQLAGLTGGQFIEIDKFDIDEIIVIMEDGVRESEVSLRMLEQVEGEQDLTFPIDDSITQFLVAISGTVSEAQLTHASASDGVSYDLMNEDVLQGTEGIDVVTHTPSLKFIRFSNQSLGDWLLQTTGVDNYNIAISATSTLSFLPEFCELLLLPPRPGYRVMVGRPLAEQKYYVEVTLVGYLESRVVDVTSLDFVSEKGELLSHVDYHGDVDDHFYVLTDNLPDTPFFVQIDGHIQSGKTFSRIFPTMVVAVKCSVDLVVEASVTAARPGETGTAYFLVENFGPEAQFDYFANDEKKYMTGWSPKTSTLPSMGSINITVTFKVPSTSVPGSVSTVTVTAASRLHQYNVNTAITYFSVLPDVQDVEPPSCSTLDLPTCHDYSNSDTCANGTWTVHASLQDNESGLDMIYSRPPDNLTLDTFTTGATHPVNATLVSSCCMREAEIIGRDMLGNIGKCQWSLGSLVGSVVEFVVEDVGKTWTMLRWTVSEVREDFYKYSVRINHDTTDDSRCRELVCRMNVTYLEPCTLQNFSLTPVFQEDGVQTQGAQLDTRATTLEIAPGPPTDPAIDYVSDTTTTLSWHPPADLKCLDHYQVCYTMFSTSEAECKASSSSSITLENLEACTLYHVTLSSVSNSGILSQQLDFNTNTDDAAPGAPENLVVTNQTANWVALSWDDPLDRASCVEMWRITYGETATRKVRDPIITADNFATISPLLACTNYTFWVSGVSPKGLLGSTKQTQTIMEETDPTPVSSVEATTLSPSSVMALWLPGESEECVHYYQVCIMDIVELNQDCRDTTNQQDTFTGLEACVDFEVTVTSVSPSGSLSHITYDMAKTSDIRTSPPTNLQITDVTAHTAVVSYGPPEENPKCVKEYDTIVKELGGPIVFSTSVSPHLESMMSGLAPCMDYGLQISAVTASGFQSDWVKVNFTTGEDTPSVPRSFSQLGVTDTSVQLRWFVPETNPGCAETYRLAWSSTSGSGSQDVTETNHPAEVAVTVEGLTACTSYTFTVGAVTPAGQEGPTAALSVDTHCSRHH